MPHDLIKDNRSYSCNTHTQKKKRKKEKKLTIDDCNLSQPNRLIQIAGMDFVASVEHIHWEANKLMGRPRTEQENDGNRKERTRILSSTPLLPRGDLKNILKFEIWWIPELTDDYLCVFVCFLIYLTFGPVYAHWVFFCLFVF